MTFVGGSSILGSAFDNLALFQDRIWLLFAMLLLVGFVLFNTVFVLLYIVSKVAGKNIAVTCKFKNIKCISCSDQKENAICQCKEKESCSGIVRFWRRYPYALAINVILVLGMIVAVVIGAIQSTKVIPTNLFSNFSSAQEERIEEMIKETLNDTVENTVDVNITISGETQEAINKEVPVTGE